MSTRPNPVFYAVVGTACAAAVALAVMAAGMYGRHRRNRTWLIETGGHRG